MADDPFDLRRFEDAQRGSYERALAELTGGRKLTHWMWYILPQLRGLGSSGMAFPNGICATPWKNCASWPTPPAQKWSIP